jgi:hypothetical protein
MKQETGLAVLAFTLLCASWPASLCAQQEGKAQQNGALKVTTRVLEQDYCTNGDVRMSLRFRYTNNGRESIILPKYSFEYFGYTISRSEKEAARHRHEMVAHISLETIIDQPFPTRGREPSPQRFIILEPGQSYEVDTRPSRADFFMHRLSDQHLRKGRHVLRLNVSTWNESIALARELAIVWRQYGVLWWEGITSEPMPFTIDEPSSRVKCPIPGSA